MNSSENGSFYTKGYLHYFTKISLYTFNDILHNIAITLLENDL